MIQTAAMKKIYRKPEIGIINAEPLNIICESGGQFDEGLSKKNTGSSSFDFSDEDEDGLFYKKYTVKW